MHYPESGFFSTSIISGFRILSMLKKIFFQKTSYVILSTSQTIRGKLNDKKLNDKKLNDNSHF
jgi:hypothetical protein